MKTIKIILAACTLAAAFSFTPTVAFADGIKIDNIRARPSLGAAKNSAAFFVIHNKDSKANKLTSAHSDVAKRVELHTHLKENGVFKMRPIESIPMPANGMAELKPGGHHVMLIGVKSKLKIGDKFMLKLNFANGETKMIHVPVLKIGAHGMMHGKKKMDHKKMEMDHKKAPAN